MIGVIVTTKDNKIEEIEGMAIINKDTTTIGIFEIIMMQSVFFVIRKGILGKISQYGSIFMKKRLGMHKLKWE